MSVTIRHATESEYPAIWALVHDEYVAQGYINPQPGGLYVHYLHLEGIPETTKLVAVNESNEIIGTISYTTDGPNKLACDVDYPKETQELREKHPAIVCVWRLAVRAAERGNRAVVTAMVQEVATRLVAMGEPLLLLLVHPRHVRIWKRWLGFEQVSQRDECKGLLQAPSVLMTGGKGSYSRIVT